MRLIYENNSLKNKPFIDGAPHNPVRFIMLKIRYLRVIRKDGLEIEEPHGLLAVNKIISDIHCSASW